MRRMRLVGAAMAAGLLAAGCSAGDMATESVGDTAVHQPDSGVSDGDAMASGGDDSAAGQDTGDAATDDAGEPEQSGGAGDGDGVVTFGGAGTAVTGRQLARTAVVVLEVQDVEQAAGRVTAAAQRAGGFVADAEVRGGDFGHGVLTLRVPASSLDATITDLAEVGLRVVESSITTEDLTEQLTDIGARLANLERLEAELQLLLSDVRTDDPEAGQLLQVFERLNQVRGEIERLEAQRAAARDRVDLATIEVELVPRSIAPEQVEPEPEGTLAQAWQATRDAFGTIADAMIWLVVTILPVGLVVLGIPAVLLWGLLATTRRRRRERAAAAPAPPAPPAARQEPEDVEV